MTRKQHYMTRDERLQLEALKRARIPVSQIAKQLGFSRQTIYNELKRGQYLHNCTWRDEVRYSADIGQEKHTKAQRHKGRPLKIGHDLEYANFLEHKILYEHYSPAAALAAARRQEFSTQICVVTLYSYISQGIFYQLTDNHLWEKPTRKPRKKDTKPQIAHKKLPSIEQRPEWINNREELGHWEMDLVVGPQGTKPALLTLVERVSRQELMFKLPDRRAATIRGVFDKLERKYPDFTDRFKSITTDNGSEFLEYDELIKSIRGGKRFDVYYCHSYAAWEKGTNENHNRMIRRFFPKGTDFTKVTKKRIAEIQDWMNSYPRKVLGWAAPNDFYAVTQS